MHILEKVFYSALAILMAALIAFLCSYKPKAGEIPVTKLVLFGTVTDVSQCDRGKSRLECWVTVVKAGQSRSYYFDVTDYPGDYLQKGDVIGLQTRTYEKSQESLLYRNGQVRYSSNCERWMPCWKNSTL